MGNLRGGNKKLRGGHIVVAAVQSKTSRVTFKKVTRAGRRPTYKKTVISTPESNMLNAGTSSLESTHLIRDEEFIGLDPDHPMDSAEADWEDKDFKLPRRATVRK